MGIFDLTGNVMEWTTTGRVHGNRMLYAASGGYYASKPEGILGEALQLNFADRGRAAIGFRCAWHPKEPSAD